ncbi:MAG: phosphatidylglycerol:prolipoprotein diacylglycerol transferase [Phycisphaerales bacterium]
MSVALIESLSAIPLAAPSFAAPPLAAWLHDLDPFLVRFTGNLGLRWYGLSYLMGFLAGYLLLRWLAKKGIAKIPVERVADVILTLIVGVVVGGRLGYVLIYQPSLLTEFSPGLPYWGVLRLSQGGMASHGGMVGIVLAAWRISRGYKPYSDQPNTAANKASGTPDRVGRCPPLHVFDLMVLIVPPGLFFGRVANFINGELLGKVVAAPGQPAPWWAVRFPQEITERSRAELVQTPEQWAQLDRLAISQLRPGESTFAQGYDHLLQSVQRGNAELAAQLEPLISARAPSQLLQAIAEGILVGLVVWFVARKPRLPGITAAWFLIAYGVLRVATEFVRLADSQFDGTGLLDSARPLGLARGQWLSAAMVLIGVGMIVFIRKRGGEKSPGWARKPEADQPTVAGSSEA